MGRLDGLTGDLQNWAALLSADERRRADRLCFEQDRRRFVAARGLLRILLASYSGRSPEGLAFEDAGNGKPELTETFAGRSLQFNCSHSHGRALYAVAWGAAVGVDLELVRPIPEAEAVVQTSFSPEERAIWRALLQSERQEAFLRAWTRKEAVLKAIGCGLALPPDRVEVTLEPGRRPAILKVDGVPAEASGWTIRDLRLPEGWVGAVVIEREPAFRSQEQTTADPRTRVGGQRVPAKAVSRAYRSAGISL
jgi:4'-phosphopantetheinyl transferase